jgi:FkbM family methyltransferase
MRFVDGLLRYRSVYSNYISILYQMKVKRKDKVDVILRSGEHLLIPSETVFFVRELQRYNKIVQNFSFDNDKGILSFYYLNKMVKIKIYKEGIYNGEVASFIGDYDFLGPIDGNTVIDIGANIGDSSIYFALKNASKVIGIEPYKWSYDMATQNIALNELENLVMIIHAGYGKSGFMEIEDKITDIGTELKEFKGGIKIPIMSLKDIVEFVGGNIKGKLLLKMDCEGCEYGILQETSEVLSKFDKIIIEYHYGCESLKTKLEESGFQVTYTKPHEWFERKGGRHLVQGYIYAKRSL